MMEPVLHHLHKKRAKTKEPFDYILYFFVFTTPLFEIPQALEIFIRHDAHDVSLVTWTYFLLSNVAWFIYGVKQNIKPLMITYTLYMIIEFAIVAGIVTNS